MEFIDMLKKRRSIRQYTKEAVTGEQLQLVINAGLLSPSSRSIRPWELIVVQNKDTLQKMSECRVGSAKMLANASAAVVVIANAEKSDVWTEDCSIVMSNMHLMADSLGLGSCWIQGRLRETSDGQSTEEYLREDIRRKCIWKLFYHWESRLFIRKDIRWMRFRKIKCIMKNMKINIQTKGNNVIFKITGDVEILETIIESEKII